MPKTATVIKAYTSPYADPWKMVAGEKMTLGKRDTDWDGWIWCTNGGGESRWVPESYLKIEGKSGIAKVDYESTELEVQVGDELVLGESESGWYWCTKQAGKSGWVPKENLKLD